MAAKRKSRKSSVKTKQSDDGNGAITLTQESTVAESVEQSGPQEEAPEKKRKSKEEEKQTDEDSPETRRKRSRVPKKENLDDSLTRFYTPRAQTRPRKPAGSYAHLLSNPEIIPESNSESSSGSSANRRRRLYSVASRSGSSAGSKSSAFCSATSDSASVTIAPPSTPAQPSGSSAGQDAAAKHPVLIAALGGQRFSAAQIGPDTYRLSVPGTRTHGNGRAVAPKLSVAQVLNRGPPNVIAPSSPATPANSRFYQIQPNNAVSLPHILPRPSPQVHYVRPITCHSGGIMTSRTTPQYASVNLQNAAASTTTLQSTNPVPGTFQTLLTNNVGYDARIPCQSAPNSQTGPQSSVKQSAVLPLHSEIRQASELLLGDCFYAPKPSNSSEPSKSSLPAPIIDQPSSTNQEHPVGSMGSTASTSAYKPGPSIVEETFVPAQSGPVAVSSFGEPSAAVVHDHYGQYFNLPNQQNFTTQPLPPLYSSLASSPYHLRRTLGQNHQDFDKFMWDMYFYASSGEFAAETGYEEVPTVGGLLNHMIDTRHRQFSLSQNVNQMESTQWTMEEGLRRMNASGYYPVYSYNGTGN